MPRSIRTLGEVRECGLELIAVCRNVHCRRQQVVDLDRLVERLGTAARMVPAFGEVHFSDRMRCQNCGRHGALLWLLVPYDPRPLLNGSRMPFKIGVWDEDGRTLMSTAALAAHDTVAHFAFDGARSAYPRQRIVLQEFARVLRDSRLTVVRGGKAG